MTTITPHLGTRIQDVPDPKDDHYHQKNYLSGTYAGLKCHCDGIVVDGAGVPHPKKTNRLHIMITKRYKGCRHQASDYVIKWIGDLDIARTSPVV